MEVKSEEIDIATIMAMIPHRYPMLLIDKLIKVDTGKSAVGIKNVTFNEPFFNGHFPGKPIMPGVLIVEAMAQTSAVLVVHTLKDETKEKLVYFMSIEEAKFRKPVVPGDRLELFVEVQRNRGPVWKFSSQATVDGVLVAEAVFTAMISR